MMGQANPQRGLFYQMSLESFVPAEHPLRAIRPLIDDGAIRRACRNLYAPIGRPSIPPEQVFLALVGGYLLGVTSERKLVMELQCNMALRWFVGLNLDQDAWDASTFSQNRRAHGEPPPLSPRPRGRHLPRDGGREGGLSVAPRSRETPAGLHTDDARGRQGFLSRGLHRSDVRA